jgi:hypothetical protein
LLVSALAQYARTADAVADATIQFGEWLPDQAELNNAGSVEALNVIPLEGSYAPFCQLVVDANGLPDAARGATAVIREDDVVQLYAGTVNAVYSRLGGGPFTELLAASTAEADSWKFIRVNEQMVAIHPQHVPVRSPVGSLTPFANVGGTPPTAACGAQVGDFLMLGNLLIDPDDGGAAVPNRIRWSGFNNIDDPWVTDVATQADFNEMPPEGGPVVAISGREVGTIFQERMISRATYRGLPDVFDITIAEDKRGCIARDSVVDVGAFQFFIAEDGFFVWNGTNSAPIGDSRINRYFFNRLQYSKRSKIVGAADFANGCVHWAFPISASGSLDEIITYSYRDNRFAHSIQTLEYLFSASNSNITLDELTDPLESYTESFDGPAYVQGARPRLAAFNATHNYGLFSGSPMAATLDTGEFSGPNGRRVFVNGVRPLVDITSPIITVQTIGRDQIIGQGEVFSAPVPQELDGICPVINDLRYMRFRVNIPVGASWKHAMGVEIYRKATGKF